MKIITRASVGVVLGLSTLVVAAPAHAATEVTKKSCAEAGGTFDSDRGTKSCAVTTTATTTGPVVSAGRFGPAGGTGGTYQLVTITQTTTTQSQQGNKPVSTTVDTSTLSSTNTLLTCFNVQTRVMDPVTRNFVPIIRQLPLANCQDLLPRT